MAFPEHDDDEPEVEMMHSFPYASEEEFKDDIDEVMYDKLMTKLEDHNA